MSFVRKYGLYGVAAACEYVADPRRAITPSGWSVVSPVHRFVVTGVARLVTSSRCWSMRLGRSIVRAGGASRRHPAIDSHHAASSPASPSGRSADVQADVTAIPGPSSAVLAPVVLYVSCHTSDSPFHGKTDSKLMCNFLPRVVVAGRR